MENKMVLFHQILRVILWSYRISIFSDISRKSTDARISAKNTQNRSHKNVKNVWENITIFNKKQQIACNSISKFKKIVNFQSHSSVKYSIKIFFWRNRNWGGLCTTYILDWTSSFSKWSLNHVDDTRMIHLILNITITCSATLVHHPLWLLWHF